MTKRSSTYLKGISETGDIANQTLFEDLIDSMGVVDSGTTFDDSGNITVDGTRVYSTTRAVTASTHSLTIAASGHVSGNYLKVIYSFSQACTLTLNNFFTLGNDTGTITPIPAGTYIFRFICEDSNDGVFLSIPNNIQSTQDQLNIPSNFIVSSSNAQNSLSWSAVANATGYTLEYSLDQSAWINLTTVGYNGTSTNYTHTGLTNGTPYYYRLKATASGYTDSAYTTGNGTPSAGTTQLTAISDLAITAVGNGFLTASFTNPNSGNEDSNLIQYSTDNFVSDINNGISLASGATGGTQTGLTNNVLTYLRVIAKGSGAYSDSDPSNVDSDTPVSIIMQDAFTGTAPDTNKWALTIPNDPYPSLTQNNALVITSTAGQGNVGQNTNFWQSVNTVTSGAIQIDFTSNSNYTYTGAGFQFMVDNSNAVLLIPDTSNKMRLIITVAGVNEYVYTPGTIDGYGNTWKIVINSSNDIRVYYLSAPDTWTAFGDLKNYDLGTNKFCKIYGTNNDAQNAVVNLDNFYMTNSNYATSTP